MKKIFIALVMMVPLLSTAQTYTVEQLIDSALLHNNATRSARLGVEAQCQYGYG